MKTVDPFAPVRVWRYDATTPADQQPWIVAWAGWAEAHFTWAEAIATADTLAHDEDLRASWATAGGERYA